jgi:putative ABC transport system substrate-binding protein
MRRRAFIAGLGGAAMWPLVARAQQPAVSVIGHLDLAQTPLTSVRPFLVGLARTGYVPGRNLAIEFRGANLEVSSLPRLAADLVAHGVDVIVTTGGVSPTLAAKAATSTTPIVFMSSEDPVEYGLVASLNRPGGNVTGVTFLTSELMPKRLNLLLELVTRATTVGYLCPTSDAPFVRDRIRDMLAAGGALEREIVVIEVHGLDFEAAFATLVEQRVGGLVVGSYTPFVDPPNRDKIIQLAARLKVPAVYPGRVYAVNGGLMGYGASRTEQILYAGLYTGRILKGEKPGDMPVIQPTKFALVINLKTAKALNLTIPETLLATADEVIE